MKVAKELAKEAKRLNICQDWHKELKGLDNKKALVKMYVDGIDFCIINDYPSNEYIRNNFKGMMEDFGVFLDDVVDLNNGKRIVLLGETTGSIRIDKYNVSEILAKHQSVININASDHSFVVVDAFDDSLVNISAYDNSKVCINKYGNCKVNVVTSNSTAIIKIVEKHKKTY